MPKVWDKNKNTDRRKNGEHDIPGVIQSLIVTINTTRQISSKPMVRDCLRNKNKNINKPSQQKIKILKNPKPGACVRIDSEPEYSLDNSTL